MIRALYIDVDITGNAFVQPPTVSPDWESPVYLFLHGYNATPQEAFQSYTQLIEAMKSKATLLDSRSWVVCWPAYVNTSLASGKSRMSGLSYSEQIPSAAIAARALRTYLDGCGAQAKNISIIAHSLGSRMALEMLDDYARHPVADGPEFALLVLMAAAVPIHLLENLLSLWQGALLPKKTLVLFSKKDIVLSGVFRVGQTIAGEGVFPRAVGASGEPRKGIWTEALPTANGHSDYFKDPGTAREIGRMLGSASASTLPSSKLATLSLHTDVAPAALRLGERRISGEKVP